MSPLSLWTSETTSLLDHESTLPNGTFQLNPASPQNISFRATLGTTPRDFVHWRWLTVGRIRRMPLKLETVVWYISLRTIAQDFCFFWHIGFSNFGKENKSMPHYYYNQLPWRISTCTYKFLRPAPVPAAWLIDGPTMGPSKSLKSIIWRTVT